MMNWYWLVLIGVMKLVIAFGPKAAREKEFNLDSPELWNEALDVVSVGACRTMLVTTPVVLAILTIGKSEADCPSGGITPLPLVLTAIALALAIWIAFRINADFFKGKAPIFVLALCLFVVEVTYMLFARDSVAIMLCAEKSAAQPVQKAPAPPRSAASSP